MSTQPRIEPKIVEVYEGVTIRVDADGQYLLGAPIHDSCSYLPFGKKLIRDELDRLGIGVGSKWRRKQSPAKEETARKPPEPEPPEPFLPPDANGPSTGGLVA